MTDDYSGQTTLDRLQPGTKCRILRIHGKGRVIQRIHTMGFVKGAVVKVIRIAPMGDPIQFHVKGYNLSLRKEEASLIEVEVIGSDTHEG